MYIYLSSIYISTDKRRAVAQCNSPRAGEKSYYVYIYIKVYMNVYKNIYIYNTIFSSPSYTVILLSFYIYIYIGIYISIYRNVYKS